MGNAIITESFSQKILKKIQFLAFGEKVKIVKTTIPEKVKSYVENFFDEELKYFQKKYLLKIELQSDEKLIIPEYRIELLNKSKKVIDVVENINNFFKNKKSLFKNQLLKEKKELKKDKKKPKKIKNKKKS